MKSWVIQLSRFLLLALLFAVIYTQAPLYTSNQNQYFLHGLAQAGFGNLAEDWLANTLDPTPVFSALVKGLYQLLEWDALFYLVYALLMGIYAWSAIGIIEHVFPLQRAGSPWKSTRFLVFLALFFLLHSAALRFALSRTLGDNWSFLLEDGVADQRLLGLVLQPSAFGVLLVLSIYLFLKNRPVLGSIQRSVGRQCAPHLFAQRRRTIRCISARAHIRPGHRQETARDSAVHKGSQSKRQEIL